MFILTHRHFLVTLIALQVHLPMDNQEGNTKKASKYRGVYRCGKKWKTQIQIEGVQHYIGVFDSEELAASAYEEAATKLGRTGRLSTRRKVDQDPVRVDPLPVKKYVNSTSATQSSGTVNALVPSGIAELLLAKLRLGKVTRSLFLASQHISATSSSESAQVIENLLEQQMDCVRGLVTHFGDSNQTVEEIVARMNATSQPSSELGLEKPNENRSVESLRPHPQPHPPPQRQFMPSITTGKVGGGGGVFVDDSDSSSDDEFEMVEVFNV